MKVDDSRLERIVTAAAAAPSVHNTQPWDVQLGRDRMMIHADTSRQLRHVDPLGREMLISCGAFLFNVRVAARRESLVAVPLILPHPGDPLLVATVLFEPGVDPDIDELDLAVAIKRRTTSRAPFDDEPLDTDVLLELEVAARSDGGSLRLIHPTDPARPAVIQLMRRAEALAAEDAVAAEEESAWVSRTPERHDGIPEEMLSSTSQDEQAPVRHFSAGAPRSEFEHRSTLAVLLTPGDEPHDWISAGQALERLLLVASTYFVRASFATTVLENPTTRHDLARTLDLVGHPQMLMRLGYTTEQQHTPRRTIQEITSPRLGPPTV